MVTNNSINLNSQGIAYYNGTGTFSGIDGGTAGNVFLSNGTGVAPSFQTTLAIANGGTGVNSVTTAPTATAFSGWDANSNLSANNFIGGYATTPISGSTVTLTVSSAQNQYFTGSGNQNVVLPVASTLVLGQSFTLFANASGGLLTVNSSGGGTISLVFPLCSATFTCVLTSGTTAASWYVSGSVYAYDQVTGYPLGSGASGAVGSVSLNPGFYILSGLVSVQAGTSVTNLSIAINSTSGSVTGNYGVARVSSTVNATISTLSIPAYALTVASTTTYYLNATATYSGGLVTGGSTFSALRV